MILPMPFAVSEPSGQLICSLWFLAGMETGASGVYPAILIPQHGVTQNCFGHEQDVSGTWAGAEISVNQ